MKWWDVRYWEEWNSSGICDIVKNNYLSSLYVYPLNKFAEIKVKSVQNYTVLLLLNSWLLWHYVFTVFKKKKQQPINVFKTMSLKYGK